MDNRKQRSPLPLNGHQLRRRLRETSWVIQKTPSQISRSPDIHPNRGTPGAIGRRDGRASESLGELAGKMPEADEPEAQFDQVGQDVRDGTGADVSRLTVMIGGRTSGFTGVSGVRDTGHSHKRRASGPSCSRIVAGHSVTPVLPGTQPHGFAASRKLASLAGTCAWAMSSSQAVREALAIVEVMQEGLASLQTVWQKVSAGGGWMNRPVRTRMPGGVGRASE